MPHLSLFTTLKEGCGGRKGWGVKKTAEQWPCRGVSALLTQEQPHRLKRLSPAGGGRGPQCAEKDGLGWDSSPGTSSLHSANPTLHGMHVGLSQTRTGSSRVRIRLLGPRSHLQAAVLGVGSLVHFADNGDHAGSQPLRPFPAPSGRGVSSGPWISGSSPCGEQCSALGAGRQISGVHAGEAPPAGRARRGCWE